MIRLKAFFTVLLAFTFGTLESMAQCNGFPELCDKKFNEVAYLTTHNAFNAEEDGFTFPNHTYGITRQLNDGIRGLMLDVYDEGGVATVYHGFTFLGTATLESNLIEVKEFLDDNPNEIVTIIFECYAAFDLVNAAFQSSGVAAYLHAQPIDIAWPTLQEMIEANKRLVVLSECQDAPVGAEWYHHVWDYAVETPFENNSNSDFTCEFNRGNEANDLLILNHFATDPNVGIGSTSLSEAANEFDFFYNRALECEAELGKFPNFPTIDFHELGEPFRVVDSLNLRQTSTDVSDIEMSLELSIFPNPTNGILTVELPKQTEANLNVFDKTGSLVFECQIVKEKSTLNFSHFAPGIYFVSLRSALGAASSKLVIVSQSK